MTNHAKIIMAVPYLLAAICGTTCAQGLWQGTDYAPGPNRKSKIENREFLVLDTGGSGGGFGHGDIRQKLHDVFFWNGKIGWTCGYGGVFATRDGGLTWTRMRRKGGWYHIEMTGPEEVWLLEGFHGQGKARLWHTIDGGGKWDEVMPGKFRGYTDLYCRGNERWVLCGDFRSYRSRDGGKTWQPEGFRGLLHGTMRMAIPADVPLPKGFAAYVFGHYRRKPRLVKSSDGGESWRVVTLPESAGDSYWPCRMFFASSQCGWVGLRGGKVLYTTDGGESWEDRPLPTDQSVSAFWLDQFGRGFAAANNTDFMRFRETLYETVDGGKTWSAVLGGAKHVSALFGLGPRRLWAVGDVPGFIQNDLVAILKSRNR